MSDPRVEGGRLSVAPEAVYTGALVMFFSNLAMPDTDPQGRPIVLWFNGIIAVCALIWGLAETMRVRKEYPWRWARTLFYDVLILVGLLIRNSDWTRLVVLVALVLYAIVTEKTAAEPRRSARSGRPCRAAGRRSRRPVRGASSGSPWSGG
ncbi:Uncharacterised protein [Bifidobacterium bifidum]|nr:Uncharacterised protein [Bifidobacterium bifidum]